MVDTLVNRARPSDGQQSTVALFARLSNLCVWYFIPYVLGIAAILKAASAISPLNDGAFPMKTELMLGLTVAELLIALALASRVRVNFVLLTARAFLGAFLLYALFEAFHRRRSCGCFGALRVSPWITAGFDAFSLICIQLALWRAGGSERGTFGRIGITRVAAVGAASALSAAIVLHAVSPNGVPELLDVSKSYVILKPEQWTGRRFPLLPYIDMGHTLSKGKWKVVLYRSDCDDCRRLIAHVAGNRETHLLSEQIAFIEVPPSVARAAIGVKSDHLISFGKLDARKIWFVRTPLVVEIVEGMVSSSHEGSEPPTSEQAAMSLRAAAKG